ncbi:MAG: hypothetical protein KDA60_11620 [Planctomycetales bacterium]|nr:hypothetical protein [Planctomycetales bacterium]
MDGGRLQDSRLIRGFGFALGVITQVVFLATVVFLFRFLYNASTRSARPWLLIDCALAIQFAVVHSVILHPTVQRRLKRWIKAEWYGLFFCLMTCGGLAITFCFWRGSEGAVWVAHGSVKTLIYVGFYGSWVMLFYSLWLSGLGFQTGLTPWWHWLRHQPVPRRPFPTTGLNGLLRHPIYLSFLGLIWFTPSMTWDHVALTGIWTAYIFIGSYLKDERLAFFLGQRYREYQARVPGYPGMFWGPLGRVRLATPLVGENRSSQPSTLRKAA